MVINLESKSNLLNVVHRVHFIGILALVSDRYTHVLYINCVQLLDDVVRLI